MTENESPEAAPEPEMETTPAAAVDTVDEGDGRQPGGRRGRLAKRLAAVLVLALPLAAGGYWMMSQPPGAGVSASLRSAGIPVPDFLMTLLEPDSAAPGLAIPPPAPAIEELAMQETSVPVDQESPPVEIPPVPVAMVEPLDADPSEERMAALEGMLDAIDAVQQDQARQLEVLSARNERLEAQVEALSGDLQSAVALAAEALDAVAIARRESQHARSLVEAAGGEEDARLEMLETDVHAIATSLKTARAVRNSLSERIEALASDLHLVARFGSDGGVQDEGFRPASTTTASAFGSNYHGSADAAAGAVLPAGTAVQGQYRVGDWVAGRGVVSSIRKTPDGDYLTTPRGVLFAPPAGVGE